MTRRYGIDTSVMVRLLTGLPPREYERCERELIALVEHDGAEVFASNQVVGEAFVAVQHHYGFTSTAARLGLLSILTSGLVAPLNGRAVIAALEASGGPGLFDRLIADDYSRADLQVLTLDRKMASLPDVRLL